MKRTRITHRGTIASLLLFLMTIMVLAASPALAHDGGDHDGEGQGSAHEHNNGGGDDDDDDVTTTSTTIPSVPATTTTMTTTMATTTTTTRPARVPSVTSTTLAAPSTTTTVPIPRDDQWEEQRLEEAPESTSTTMRAPGQDDFESNETLVLSFAPSGGDSGGDGGGYDGPENSDGNGFHISPREGLTVAFRTAVEVIEGHLVQSMLLGILVAALFMAGVDKRKVEPTLAPAPVLRSYSTGHMPRRPGTSPGR